jgi:hypothetical protein
MRTTGSELTGSAGHPSLLAEAVGPQSGSRSRRDPHGSVRRARSWWAWHPPCCDPVSLRPRPPRSGDLSLGPAVCGAERRGVMAAGPGCASATMSGWRRCGARQRTLRPIRCQSGRRRDVARRVGPMATVHRLAISCGRPVAGLRGRVRDRQTGWWQRCSRTSAPMARMSNAARRDADTAASERRPAERERT